MKKKKLEAYRRCYVPIVSTVGMNEHKKNILQVTKLLDSSEANRQELVAMVAALEGSKVRLVCVRVCACV